MARLYGTVISVTLETDVPKQGGGSYKGWQLIYKTQSGEVRTVAKPITGLKYNKALENGLKSLSSGDEFTLEQEKNGAYNEVKSIVKGIQQGEEVSVDKSSTPSKAPQYQARDFADKAERARVQEFIVRQNALTNAVASLSVGAKAPLNSNEVTSLAEQYVGWVFKQTIDGLESDIPE